MENILKRDGLSFALLEKLSYQTELGIRLKKNLHYFEKNMLFDELIKMNKWYDSCEYLHNIAIDYRIKSIQSAMCTLCDNYEDILALQTYKWIRVADMSDGKSKDDGYRGVHVYFQLSSFHYPIEIQYNTYYDRQFSNWLHKYVYKRGFDDQIGCMLRQAYENAKIRNENEFRERFNDVLSDSEKI